MWIDICVNVASKTTTTTTSAFPRPAVAGGRRRRFCASLSHGVDSGSRREEEEAEEQRKVKVEEKMAKKALAAWNARRKAVTDEMYAPLEVGRGTLSCFERWTSWTPPCLLPSPRGGRGGGDGRRSHCSAALHDVPFFLSCGTRVLTPRLLVIIRVFALPVWRLRHADLQAFAVTLAQFALLP